MTGVKNFFWFVACFKIFHVSKFFMLQSFYLDQSNFTIVPQYFYANRSNHAVIPRFNLNIIGFRKQIHKFRSVPLSNFLWKNIRHFFDLQFFFHPAENKKLSKCHKFSGKSANKKHIGRRTYDGVVSINFKWCVKNAVQISPREFFREWKEHFLKENSASLSWNLFNFRAKSSPKKTTSQMLAWFFIIQQKFIELKKICFPYFFIFFFMFEKIFSGVETTRSQRNEKPNTPKRNPRRCDTEKTKHS